MFQSSMNSFKLQNQVIKGSGVTFIDIKADNEVLKRQLDGN